MALVQRKESDRETNMACQGFTVKSTLKNAKVMICFMSITFFLLDYSNEILPFRYYLHQALVLSPRDRVSRPLLENFIYVVIFQSLWNTTLRATK